MAVAPIPPGYASVTPYLIVRDARKAIDFYQRAFGAVELFRLEGPDGTIGHAEIKIGNSPVMLAEGMDGYPDPLKLGGAAVSFMLYVPDVDAAFARAVAPARRSSVRSPTSSTAIAPARWPTRSATSGRSARTSRMSRRRKWTAASRR